MNHRHILNNLSVFCFVLFSLENVDSNYIIILLSNTSKGQVNISVTSSQGDCIVNHILRSKHRNTSLLGPDSTLVFRCSRPLEIDCKIVVLGLSIIKAQVVKEVRLSDFLLLRLRVSLDLVGAWCACLVAWS